jgi:hypothetical protein
VLPIINWNTATLEDVVARAKLCEKEHKPFQLSPRWFTRCFGKANPPGEEDRPIFNLRNEPDWAAIAKVRADVAHMVGVAWDYRSARLHTYHLRELSAEWQNLNALLADLPQGNEVRK